MSAYLIARNGRRGRTYHVRCRPAGRAGGELHVGAFPTLREARDCKAWADGELARGRVPDRRAMLATAVADDQHRRTIAQAGESWIADRLDYAEKTRRNYEGAVRRLHDQTIGVVPAARVTIADLRAWIGELVDEGLVPGTIRKYLSVVQLILDHAGVTPNPARDRLLKLPRDTREIPRPPSADQVRAVLRSISPTYRVAVAMLEATGMRIGEACRLEPRHIEPDRERVMVPGTKTGAARRWSPLDAGLARLVLAQAGGDACFPGVYPEQTAHAVKKACRAAGVSPAFTPHGLRHRYCTRRVLLGDPLPLIARDVGHTKSTTTMDVYTHAQCDTEEAWRVLLDHDALG